MPYYACPQCDNATDRHCPEKMVGCPWRKCRPCGVVLDREGRTMPIFKQDH